MNTEKKVKIVLNLAGAALISAGAGMYSFPAGMIILGSFAILAANRDRIQNRKYKMPE